MLSGGPFFLGRQRAGAVPAYRDAGWLLRMSGLAAEERRVAGISPVAVVPGHVIGRDGRDQQTWERELHENMEQAYAKAYFYGGVASGEHGIGIAKRPYFLRETAQENLAVMNTIKTALDPKHTLNDQKSYIVGGK